MKKILSFMLVLAMLAMMCINVSADTTNLVGTRKDPATTQGGTIEDGVKVDAFVSKDNSSDIKATITTANSVRYAVDLDYTPFVIKIDSTADWDVDTLQYHGSTTVTVGNNSETFTSGAGEQTIENVAKFIVTNYSNAPVAVSATVTPATNYRGYITGVVTGEDELEAVQPVIGKSAEAVTAEYSASLTCTDWTSTFASATGENIVIATVTFTISKTAVTTAPSTAPANDAGAGA